MKTQTQLLLELWLEARTRFTNQINSITEGDLKKKLLPLRILVSLLIIPLKPILLA